MTVEDPGAVQADALQRHRTRKSFRHGAFDCCEGISMNEASGMIRPELQALPQIRDRMTFLYLEHCQLNRDDSAITFRDERERHTSLLQIYRC